MQWRKDREDEGQTVGSETPPNGDNNNTREDEVDNVVDRRAGAEGTGNPQNIRCKIIREPKEIRIYGMLPYNFYILSLVSLFGLYLMFHGVRDDVRSLYEIVKTPKIKIVGSEKCTGDSCQCKRDICTDVKVDTTKQTMSDKKGK
jgi:hypothetical protein